MTLQWDSSYSVGDDTIDEQRQELVARANQLLAVTNANANAVNVGCMTLFSYV